MNTRGLDDLGGAEATEASNQPAVFGADDDAVAKHEVTFSHTLSGHFSCCGCSSPKSFGLVGQLDPFSIPDIFIVEEVEIEPVHGRRTISALQRPNG